MDAYKRLIAVLREVRDASSPEEMEQIATTIERALRPLAGAAPRPALIQDLTGDTGEDLPTSLDREAANMARYFALRRGLLADALTAPQVARLLGSSRQTPHDRAKAGTLLAIPDRGTQRFPRWQFDPQGPHGTLPGLPRVLKTLNVAPLEKAAWFVRPSPMLGDRSPAEALKAGETEQVMMLARGVGVA